MYLLLDIGGTNIRASVSKKGIEASEPLVIPTPQKFKDGILKIKELAAQLSGSEKYQAAIVGIAGPFNKEKTAITSSPNLKDWNNKPLKAELEKAIDCDNFVLENDAALAALGEAVYGAGRTYEVVAFLTISTGVGGARVVRGRIDEYSIGFEPGKQIIDQKTSATLEDYLSGASIKEKTGRNPEDISDRVFWEEKARVLAIGLNNIIATWSPNIIVLGGPLMNKIDIGKVALNLKKTLKAFPEPPPLTRAEHGSASGIYGALALINKK